MLQVEIVCNEHVIHPFRTMKFIWISEWLNRVSVKCLGCQSFRLLIEVVSPTRPSSFWEFANAQAPFYHNSGKHTKLEITVKE